MVKIRVVSIQVFMYCRPILLPDDGLQKGPKHVAPLNEDSHGLLRAITYFYGNAECYGKVCVRGHTHRTHSTFTMSHAFRSN